MRMDRNYVEISEELERQLKAIKIQHNEALSLLVKVLDEYENEDDVDNDDIIKKIRTYIGR